MAEESKQKLRLATIVYMVLLLYVVAALLWWAITLLKQADTVYELKKNTISLVNPSSSEAKNQLAVIEDEHARSFNKFIGEGGTFLLLILLGAVFVYRSVKKQFILQQQQQNFVMAITHELKTPIAVSKLNLETLQKYKLEETKREKLVQTTLQETLRLDNLINNILISSQLENSSYHISKEEINFSDVVKDVSSQFTIRYPQRKLEVQIQPDVDITGDPMLLKLLVSNLLENANKYSPPGAPISLILTKQNKTILEVIDEGEGIGNDEKEKIFQKFYRIGSERTRKSQGTGLGLYICKKIVKDHKGVIMVEDNKPTGSKFIVQLPT